MALGIGWMLIIWVTALSLTIYGTYITILHFKAGQTFSDRSSPSLSPLHFHSPSISILKPLKGHDEGLEENLLSFFQLDYPNYEILFSVAEKADPACLLVVKLMERYPHVNLSAQKD